MTADSELAGGSGPPGAVAVARAAEPAGRVRPAVAPAVAAVRRGGEEVGLAAVGGTAVAVAIVGARAPRRLALARGRRAQLVRAASVSAERAVARIARHVGLTAAGPRRRIPVAVAGPRGASTSSAAAALAGRAGDPAAAAVRRVACDVG